MRVLLSICLFVGCLLLLSQPLKFKNLTVNVGLSHSDVRSVTADENGLIWLATNSGLNRYDGYQLKVFKNDLADSKSLPNNRIAKVLTNQNGLLYMLSEKKEAYFYDVNRDHFGLIECKSSNCPEFEELFSLRSERFFLRTFDNRIFEISVDSNRIAKEVLVLDPNIKVISSHYFFDRFYFLLENGNISSLSETNGQLEALRFGSGSTLGWSNSNEESILVCTTEGIYSISEDGVTQLLKYRFPKSKSISDLLQDHEGGFWIAFYSEGVAYLGKNDGVVKATNYVQEEVLATNRINDLYIDEFNELWIATSGAGIYHVNLHSKPFHEISKTAGYSLPDNYITAICNSKNDLWVGTRKGLVKLANYLFAKGKNENLLEDKHISRIFKDHSDRIFVGTRWDGLYYAGNGFFEKVETLESEQISGIAQDHYGRIWVTTFDKGVSLLNSDDLSKLYEEHVSLPSSGITYIHIDHKQPIVWLGTFDEGLIAIDISNPNSYEVESYTYDSRVHTSLSSDYIWPIAQTENGDLWVGSIGGGINHLVRLPDGQVAFDRFTVNEGLPDNDIESILIDDEGLLWLGGRGLSVFDPVKKVVLNNYNFEDGLQSNSFKIGAAHKGVDGRLFFGGINGLNHFLPEEILPNQIQAKLVFDELSILGSPIKVGQSLNERIMLRESLNNTQELTFESNQNEFTISVLGVHHGNPEKNLYQYKLEGYNDDWIEVSSQNRNITFANLKRGNYVFKAKVSNGDDKWSDTRELKITVLPPWYLTWWALLSYFLFLFILLLSYRYLIIRQVNLRKDLILSENENQMNEDRLTLFTNISHEIRTPLTLIKGPIEDLISEGDFDTSKQSELLVVNKNVDRLLRLANQLLDFRKYESGQVQLYAAEGDFVSFVKEICVLFKAEARRRNITLSFNPSSDKVLLTYDRDKLEIVLANLLANAIKYTDDHGQIDVSLDVVGNASANAVFRSGKLSKHYLQISISDTGKGMSREEVKKVFDRFYQIASINQLDIRGTGIGLALVKNIVLQHKGEIDLKSKESIGSVFTIKLPFGDDHLNEKEVISDFKDSESIASFDTLKGSPQEVTQEKNAPSRSDLKKPLVLVVEDSDDVAQYICKSLNHTFRTKHAQNGRIGLAKAEELLPDIIVSDVMMPEMDGIEMLNQIRKNHNISFIPVIMLTARTSTLYEVQGIQTGAQDYITKPFNPKILSAKILSILEVRKSYRTHYLKSLKNGASESELPSAEYKFIEKLKSQVLDNLTNEEFSVTELTKMVGMSQSAFYKKVKELTGRSTVQFIRDVRLKKAAELIKNGELTISQIAYSVGINDPKFFREKFKELFDINPSDYRKSIKE